MSGYTALVTGGAKGIGADLATALLKRHHRVVTVDILHADVAEGQTHHEVDLLDIEATKAAAQKIAAEHEITHFVHNAGLIWPNLLEDAEPEDIAGLAQLHMGSALSMMQAVLPGMKERGFGRVAFNASRAALGAPTRTAYGATKAGIIGMARTWALELAPHGITVNVVAPGPVLTDNFWGIIEKGSDRQHELAKRIPVGRLGETKDVVNAFLYFLDPETSFVTGQTLYVCGGASVGTLTI
ncbi:MAG: SDR family NAD(P)-dependent oxidoreductase [Paracoccaceae bacterium]